MVVAFRSSEWDTPLWSRPNRGAGRFHRQLSTPTQYWCSHPLGVFAERLRQLGREVTMDIETIRWRTWCAHVNTSKLASIDFDNASAHGISPEELVGDDWGPCQDLALRLREAGEVGLIAPSAALPGTQTIVLFGPRFMAPYLLEVVDPEIDVATALATEASMPPYELIPRVRWHGEPHAGLDHWHQFGQELAFVDLIPSQPAPATAGQLSE